MQKIKNKSKGIALIILAIAWIFFVYNFDNLIGKPKGLGTKAIIGLLLGVIAFINGIRIYRRK